MAFQKKAIDRFDYFVSIDISDNYPQNAGMGKASLNVSQGLDIGML